MSLLPHQLDRTVVIRATPDTVFRYFTDSPRWAAWWGAGSSIDARPGGRMLIRYPNGVEASGEVVEVRAPTKIVFTYGYTSGTPITPGSSRVTIHLEPEGAGTRLRLVHDFAEPAVRDEHVQGWRYQLSLFSNVVADEVNAGAADAIDAWFTVWAEPDTNARQATLARIALPDVRFQDRFANIEGIADLNPHVGAAQLFMPGMRMERDGQVRHCQGLVLADWIARSADGVERARGTNLFALDPLARIEFVTGFARGPV